MHAGEDGFAVATQIKADPTLADATILMLSSQDLAGDSARCRELRIALYLTKLLHRDVTSVDDIEQILKALPKGAVDAIYHVPSSLVGTHVGLVVQKAEEDTVPLAATDSSMVEIGALVSYGSDIRLLGVQAAKLVAKILKGVKPSELSIQTPEKLILAVNLTTARAIGLAMPRSILERTDRIVE